MCIEKDACHPKCYVAFDALSKFVYKIQAKGMMAMTYLLGLLFGIAPIGGTFPPYPPIED